VLLDDGTVHGLAVVGVICYTALIASVSLSVLGFASHGHALLFWSIFASFVLYFGIQ
jgi:hypothetical protein